MYRDWHSSTERQFYTLAEVRYSLAIGKTEPMNQDSAEHATWMLRLMVETGFVSAVPVNLPALPPKATPSLKRVYEGFKLLLGCKWLYSPGAPTTFTRRFAERWCGVSECACGVAINRLIKGGIIVPVGYHRKSGPCGKSRIFLPGPVI